MRFFIQTRSKLGIIPLLPSELAAYKGDFKAKNPTGLLAGITCNEGNEPGILLLALADLYV